LGREEKRKRNRKRKRSVNLVDYNPRGISGHIATMMKICLRMMPIERKAEPKSC
jgi:hypothetical protein